MKSPILFIVIFQLLCALGFADEGSPKDKELPVAPFCGNGIQTTSRVLNGDKAGDDEFPWVASLRVYPGESLCTGTLINTRWVLTAAHCLVHLKYALFANSRVVATINESIPHPNYNESIYAFDIALLRLDQPIRYSAHVQPICLPLNPIVLNVGLSTIVAGWGDYTKEIYGTKYLRKTSMDIISDLDCDAIFKKINQADFYNQTAQICTGNKSKSTCPGDSGGPLMVQIQEATNFYQIGVTSIGRQLCEMLDFDVPSVFQNVQLYIQWINETINNFN